MIGTKKNPRRNTNKRTLKNIGGTKYFHFRRLNGENRFDHALQSVQCDGHLNHNNPAAPRCRRRSVMGTPYCRAHLKSIKHLSIKPSTVAGAGMGLFADRTGAMAGEVVFENNTIIVPYVGEPLTTAEVNARYGADDNVTAPYVFSSSQNHHLDGAVRRGVGNFANTSPGHNNVTLTTQNNLRSNRIIRQGQELFAVYGRRYQINDGHSSHSTNNYRFRNTDPAHPNIL